MIIEINLCMDEKIVYFVMVVLCVLCIRLWVGIKMA